MPIRIGYDPVGLGARWAYAAGLGMRQETEAERRRQERMFYDQLAQQGDLSQMLERGRMERFGREATQQAEMTRLLEAGRGERAEAGIAERRDLAELGMGERRELAEMEQGRRDMRGLEDRLAARREGVRSGELEYLPEQLAERRRILARIDAIRRSDLLSPEEKQTQIQQQLYKLWDIEPSPKEVTEAELNIEDEIKRRVSVDPVTGARTIIQPDGRIDIKDPPKAEKPPAIYKPSEYISFDERAEKIVSEWETKNKEILPLEEFMEKKAEVSGALRADYEATLPKPPEPPPPPPPPPGPVPFPTDPVALMRDLAGVGEPPPEQAAAEGREAPQPLPLDKAVEFMERFEREHGRRPHSNEELEMWLNAQGYTGKYEVD